MNRYNWGILAPGNIAASFADALNSVDNANLYSVASRSYDRAQVFAKRYGADKVSSSYAELIADPDVDIIYIASPHSSHAQQSIDCLAAGKAVLCEKPMTVNALEAKDVIRTAETHNQFYMEALWTRFLPIYKKIGEWIADTKIGDVEMVQANFGFSFPANGKSRVYSPNLAGGCLLDMGIYPITFAQMILAYASNNLKAAADAPSDIVALSHIGESGVDERTGIILKYPDGKVATLNSSLKTNTSGDAWIFGSRGNIYVPSFWRAESATLFTGSELPYEKVEIIERPHANNGYEYEIIEVHRCIEQGLLQSPLMSWDESLNVIQILDEVRKQVGLIYPFEQ